MTPFLLLLAGALLGSSALAAVVVKDRLALPVGAIGGASGCALGAAASGAALLREERASWTSGWSLPIGELHVGLDPLSSFFLLCVFTVGALAAVYGAGYLRAEAGRRRLGPPACFFNLLVVAMAVLVVARDGVLFLMAWEVMTVSSFFLVIAEDERKEARRAGLTYLIASQLGTACVFVLFALLARGTATFDFDAFARGDAARTGLAGVCFLLALVGFGTKAGFWPVHIWLPDAHSAAPSHVSALMSGVMIKMGIYGLLRVLTFLGSPAPWWGALVIAIGAVSGVAGVLQALAQHDLKRLLAYHSVENIGIIALGVGIGLVGQSQGNPGVAFFGFAGALLHVLNHGLFKGLLFQGAGSVFHGAGTRDIDSLGALARRMPVTALGFLVGAVAISGLPPLNGFVSEWLIYVGAFRAGSSLPTSSAVAAFAAVPALALIGGLAVACFVKAFGVVFLGEPRTPAASAAHESGALMLGPMIAGAVLCAAIGVWPAGAIRLVAPVATSAARLPAAPLDLLGPLPAITFVGVALVAVVAMLAAARRALLRGQAVTSQPTWGCGYAAPTARMQYTAASFASPLLAPFAPLLHATVDRVDPVGYFPASARYEEHFGDVAGERLLVPASRRLVRALSRLRIIQGGRIHLYLLYVLVALVVLLVWQLAGTGGR